MDMNLTEAILMFGLVTFGQVVWKYDTYWDAINTELLIPILVNGIIVGLLFYLK